MSTSGAPWQLTGPAVDVHAPADGSLVGRVRLADVSQVDDAVERARRGAAGWRRSSPHDRWLALSAGASAMEAAQEDIATLHSLESGKVIVQSRREVAGAASLVRANAELARYAAGQLAPTGALPGGERDLTWVEQVPLGVIVCVIPFNFPVELTMEKAAAAIAAGNVAIIKPPPQNPLATIEACRLLGSALPDGVLQVLPGGTELSAALCAADGVDAVSLTGGVAAGVAVATATAAQLRPLHLELGGNGASIVLPDADLDLVVTETLRGRLLMNGQACAATKRLVVHDAVADEVVDRLDAALGAVRMGDPTDPGSDLGPLIDATSAARVAAQVEHAVVQGAQRVRGQVDAAGAWFHPTLLAGVPAGADVAIDDEIFGPVVSVIPVRDERRAVDVVQQSSLGLTAAVFSADLAHAVDLAQQLDVGGVVINGTNNYRPPVVPFGGVGMAGSGREGLGWTMQELTRTRFIALRGLRPAAVAVDGDNHDG